MERVQLNLERLLPELRDLEKRKLFTKVRLGFQGWRHCKDLAVFHRFRPA